MAGVVAEFERSRLDLETLRPLDKPSPIGAPAEFAVGHNLKPDLLLQRDHVLDALVLHASKLILAHVPAAVPAEGLAQGLRPQQTADVVGAERRAALKARGHAGVSSRVFYNSIGGI